MHQPPVHAGLMPMDGVDLTGDRGAVPKPDDLQSHVTAKTKRAHGEAGAHLWAQMRDADAARSALCRVRGRDSGRNTPFALAYGFE